MFFSRKKKDTGLNTVHRVPTMASWPRRVSSLNDIPELYWPELEPWLESRPDARLLFIPLFDKRTGTRPEYAAAWDKNTLLLLVRRPEGTLIRTEIPQKNVVQVRYFRSILDCSGTVTYLENDVPQIASFYFNYSTEKEFVPIFNMLLGQPDDHAANILDHDNSACAALRDECYELYNFGRLVYRMDDVLQDYFWTHNEYKEKWYSREIMKTEYLVAAMGNGLASMSFQVNRNHQTCDYIPWDYLKHLELDEQDGVCRMRIDTSASAPLTLPVSAAKSGQVRDFVRTWSPAL